MRGIPSTFLFSFFILLFLIEIFSLIGIRLIIQQLPIKIQKGLSLVYYFLSISISGLLLYSFSNPEEWRETNNYTFLYFVLSIAILYLTPKFIFSIAVLLSFLHRWFIGLRSQLIVLVSGIIICTGAIATIASGLIVGKNDLTIVEADLQFDNWPEQLDGYTIVQISDIHLGSFQNKTLLLTKALERIEQIRPDMLLFTGDLVNNFSDEIKGYENLMKRFHAKNGKYAILGNHDYGDYSNWPDHGSKRNNLLKIKESIENAGFKLLLNEWISISAKDTSFTIIGVENWGHPPFSQYANLYSAMNGIPANSFQILLSHDPMHWTKVIVPTTNVELTFSGHTHGGQFGFSIAGIRFSPIYFIQNKWNGLYKEDKQYLYVNRGIGTIGFPGRIDMSPEISVFKLYRTKNH